MLSIGGTVDGDATGILLLNPVRGMADGVDVGVAAQVPIALVARKPRNTRHQSDKGQDLRLILHIMEECLQQQGD